MTERLALGAKLRALRRQQHLTQTELARRLGISPSYLNLIEHNRRAFGADLLVKLGEILPLDLKTFSPEHDGRTATELLEVFGDPMFENFDVIAQDVKELASSYPAAARSVIRLYDAFRAARESAQDLAETVVTGRLTREGTDLVLYAVDGDSGISAKCPSKYNGDKR